MRSLSHTASPSAISRADSVHFRALLSLAFALAGSVSADSVQPWMPWEQGEQLTYKISWGFVSAGSANMDVRPVDDNHFEFQSVARNNGAFNSIYPVADTVFTYAQRYGLLPDVFRKTLNEGSFYNNSTIRFDRENGKAVLADTVFKDRDRKRIKSRTDTAVSIKGWEHCIVTAFYLVRGMDFSKSDKHTYFAAVSGKKRYVLHVILHGKETIKTDLGTFRCIKVEPVLGGDGIFKTTGKLFIWISDDYRRLPVMVKTEITIGSVVAELSGFHQEPLKNKK